MTYEQKTSSGRLACIRSLITRAIERLSGLSRGTASCEAAGSASALSPTAASSVIACLASALIELVPLLGAHKR
jgi:hypothetical protein